MKTFIRVNIVLILIALLSSCDQGSNANKELLICNKPWSEKSEFEKIIGKWCGPKYKPGVGRTSVSRNIKFQTIYCFYSDHTMKEFMLTDSYIDSEDEMESGTNVNVENGILSYESSKYGHREFPISVGRTFLEIEGVIAHGGSNRFDKCQ